MPSEASVAAIFWPMMPGLAHAGDDHAPFALEHDPHRSGRSFCPADSRDPKSPWLRGAGSRGPLRSCSVAVSMIGRWVPPTVGMLAHRHVVLDGEAPEGVCVCCRHATHYLPIVIGSAGSRILAKAARGHNPEPSAS